MARPHPQLTQHRLLGLDGGLAQQPQYLESPREGELAATQGAVPGEGVTGQHAAAAGSPSSDLLVSNIVQVGLGKELLLQVKHLLLVVRVIKAHNFLVLSGPFFTDRS